MEKTNVFVRWLLCIFVAYIAVIGLDTGEAQAQACPAGKFCYYIPAGLGTPPGYNVDWDLIIASSQGTVTGEYKIGTAAAVPFSVTPATPATVDLSPTEGVTINYGVVEKRGIYIEADSEALNVVRRLIVGPWQSSASMKDNTRSLGKRFRLGGYSLSGRNTTDTGFDMVSVYAPSGGTVSITAPSGATLPFWEGSADATVTVSMAAGETYILRTRIPGTNVCTFDMTGALVTSTNNISVTTGGRGWAGASAGNTSFCANAGGCGDDGEDHIFPINRMGTQYVVNQYNTSTARSVAVVADEDSTAVSINGTSTAMLNAGEVYYFRPTGTTFIETSKVSYVYQNAGRNGCEMGLAFVPPVSFGGTAVNTAAFNVSGAGTAKILIETTKLNTISFDGALVVNPSAVLVPTHPEWSVVTLTASAGFHNIEADGDFQLGLATGTGGTGLFAYYNIFNAANCGNNQIDMNEGCDDGNRDNGDGCSSTCKIEVGTGPCQTPDQCVNGAFCDPNGICVECLADANCNDANDCTTDTCNQGTCGNVAKNEGDLCAGGVCNGAANGSICVNCIDDNPANGGQDSGCPNGSPVCDTSGQVPVCLGCTNNADCNDGNDCTIDTCNAGTCATAPETAGTSCDNNSGVCNGDAVAPTCDACIDDVQNGTDTGCDASTPNCDRSVATPVCVECLLDTQCPADSVCSASACATLVVALATPVDGASTNDNTPTLSGTATDGQTVTVMVANALNVTVFTIDVIATQGTWSIDSSVLVDGDYTVTATVNGNNNTVQDSHTFTVDTIAPTISITQPSDSEIFNTSTPGMNGQGEPDLPVQVVIRDNQGTIVETINTTTDQNGQWMITAMNLADGGYDVQATITDSAGNTDTAGPVAFSVDTTAPAVDIVAPADGSTVNDNTPDVTGTTDTDATDITVTFVDAQGNTVQTLMTTPDAAGNWSVTPTALADGDYKVTAEAFDNVGNSASDTHTLTIDTTAPAISLDTPVDGSSSNDDTPTFTGQTEPGVTVSIQVLDSQGNVVQTLTVAADAQGAYTVDATALPEGLYTAQASTTDVAGNVASSTINGFGIDLTVPTITLDAPVDGTFTNDTTPTVTGQTEAGATVEVQILDDQNAVVQTLTATVDGQGIYTVDTTALPEGTYTATATATDTAGNTATAGPNSFVVDLTDPAVTIDNPIDGSVTSNKRPDISGTADPGATVVVEVTNLANMVVFTTTVTADAQTGAWSDAVTSDLLDGPYTISATATDRAGNSANATSGFTVDTTALPLTIDAPTAGQSTSDNTPDVTGTTAADAVVTLTITDDAGATVETLTVTADANGDWTTTLAQLADGNYNVTAEVTNVAGTTTTQSTNFTVDTVAPTLTLDTPVDGASTNDDTPNIAGTSQPGVTVTITVRDAAGNIVGTGTPTVNGMGGWNIDSDVLADGTYTVEATATDAAGNTINAGPNTFTVDTTAPTVAISAPTANQIVATRDVDVTGTSDIAQDVVVEIVDANGLVVDTQTVTTDANGDWTIQTLNLANGDYTARATATDAASNVATATQTFSVDSDEALIQVTAPVDGTVTSNTKPVITGVADVDATVTVTIKDPAGNVVGTFTPAVDAQGNWTVTPDMDLTEGVHTIEASSTRPNGKMASVTATVEIDTEGPTTTITAPADGMITSNTQPVITGTTEPNTEVAVSVTNAAGTVVFEGVVTSDANGDWTLTPDTALTDDTYTINATGTDAAGNTTDATPVTVTIDTNAPTVTISAPTMGETIDTDTPTVTGTAEPGASVDILIDGAVVGTVTADANGDWTFDVPDALTEGEHTIEAKSTDGAGNEGSSGEITVTYESPKSPVVITSPTDGGDVTGPSVTVTGTGEPGDEITVTIDGKPVTTVVDENGDWTVTVNDVPEGDQTIEAKAGDMSVTVNVKVTNPVSTDRLIFAGAGCSSTDATPASAGWLLLLVGLVGLRRRRKRA